MSKSKIVLGFLAGAAAGAILGILFAPQKGAKTRKKIAKKTTEAGDSLKHAFEDFVDTIKEKYAMVAGEAEEVVEKGKAKMYAAKKEAKEV